VVERSDSTPVASGATWCSRKLRDACTLLCDYVTRGLTDVGSAGRKSSFTLLGIKNTADDWEELA
jgi:hypothetical protein